MWLRLSVLEKIVFALREGVSGPTELFRASRRAEFPAPESTLTQLAARPHGSFSEKIQ